MLELSSQTTDWFENTMSEYEKNAGVSSPEAIARMVASIVASTKYAHKVWAELEHAEKEKIVMLWATFIRDNTETAADKILNSILSHTLLGKAWNKLYEIDGLSLQRPAIVHLVSIMKR